MSWESAVKQLDPGTNIFKVLVYLSFKGHKLPSEIAGETGIKPGSVRPALRALLDMGLVAQEPGGRYSSHIPFTEVVSYLYSLVLK